MTPDTRHTTIKAMLTKSASIVGLAPLSKITIDTAHDNMIRRGVLNKKEPYNLRIQRVVKSLVKTWALNNLKMPNSAWDDINIVEISQTVTEGSDIVFIRCETMEDAAKITTYAKNLSNGTEQGAPRIVTHVDPRARSRYNAFCTMAKAIREHSEGQTQTSLRIGKNDYLLRKRTKGDSTPWSRIPPVRIDQELPPFQIGLYKELFNPKEKTMEQTKQQMEQMEQDIIADDKITKRDRTKDDSNDKEVNKLPAKLPRTRDPLRISSDSESESSVRFSF